MGQRSITTSVVIRNQIVTVENREMIDVWLQLEHFLAPPVLNSFWITTLETPVLEIILLNSSALRSMMAAR
ncbi:hypothetical protein Q1695_004973 [Nippostrongylus brasiliensis]|nr:hypothetical protein Q1695_004973 [Nippostrongylus brasiliensis]